MITPAQVDYVYASRTGLVAHGSVAKKLLANNFRVSSLRTNDVLLYDEWKHIDREVLKAAQQRLVGVGHLIARDLVYRIPEGMAKTVLAYQDASDTEAAEISMDGKTRGQRDRLEFDTIYLPLPIIHKDFNFSARLIQESRQGNMPLDTTMAERSARKVAEKVEEILFTGASTYTFGGGTIYGYMDHPNRNQVTLTANWDDSAASGEDIVKDVRDMKQASIDAKYFGPWVLYVPTNFETKLDDDFKTNSDKTVRQRILEIEGIEAAYVADKLTDDNVLLVSMQSDVVRMVEALPVTTLEWDEEGGMDLRFKVMTILIPQIRSDQDGNSGVTHLA